MWPGIQNLMNEINDTILQVLYCQYATSVSKDCKYYEKKESH